MHHPSLLLGTTLALEAPLPSIAEDNLWLVNEHWRQAKGTDQRLSYSIEQLVRATGVGRSKIYAEIAAGRLQARKVGARTIVLHDEALAWLRSLPGFLAP